MQIYNFIFETAKFYGIFSVTTTRISIFSEIRYKGAVFWGDGFRRFIANQ